jgi:hypothetical protein
VFAALVVASFAAFFVAQRLKHTPAAVAGFEISSFFYPRVAGPYQWAHISVRIAHEDRVTITIVSSAGEDVATLVRARPLGRYEWLRVRWNGRRGARGNGAVAPTGRLAPAGEYRVRVALAHQKRPLLLPRGLQLQYPRRVTPAAAGA